MDLNVVVECQGIDELRYLQLVHHLAGISQVFTTENFAWRYYNKCSAGHRLFVKCHGICVSVANLPPKKILFVSLLKQLEGGRRYGIFLSGIIVFRSLCGFFLIGHGLHQFQFIRVRRRFFFKKKKLSKLQNLWLLYLHPMA